jgi:putative FmdB family regulatory protein
MPLYTYECSACRNIFDIRHSIKEKIEECETCKETDTLSRLPPIPLILKKQGRSSQKAGRLVKNFIEETKHELAKEKDELKQREHE